MWDWQKHFSNKIYTCNYKNVYLIKLLNLSRHLAILPISLKVFISSLGKWGVTLDLTVPYIQGIYDTQYNKRGSFREV